MNVVGVGFGFVKEFSAPLLTLTKCFWPPQLQQCPPPCSSSTHPPACSAATARGVAASCPCPCPAFLAGKLSTHMHNCLVFICCAIAAQLLLSNPVGACSLSLSHTHSLTLSLSLSYTACSVPVARVVVCVHFSLGFSWHFCGLLSG